MDNLDSNDIFGSNKGYSLKQGDLFEWIISQSIATTLLVSETLRRQIELEQLIKNNRIDSEIVDKKLTEITDLIAERATAIKNSTIADLYLRDKEE